MAKGGARIGAGRPKGGKNKATKEKEAIEAELKQKVMRSVTRLFNAQMALAEGVQHLWRIDKDKKGNNEKPVIVTDQTLDPIKSRLIYYLGLS